MKSLSKKESLAVLEFKRRLNDEFGKQINQAFLFGSKARGEAKPTSDIDILVVINKEDRTLKRKILNLAFDVMLDRNIELSVIVIPNPRWQKYSKLPTSFGYSIQKEALNL
jgi:predicted nucleotidyltransferase